LAMVQGLQCNCSGAHMASLLTDLRYGLRLLARSPGFTAVAVLTIAIGIGVNTTIFSWIRAVLLNPLPGAAEPDRVVTLETLAPSGESVTTSYLDYRDFRDHAKLLDGITLAQPVALAVGDERQAERIWAELVSGSFFDVLGVKPERGRFFSAAEKGDAQNAHPVVVISHSLWKSRYHADRSAIGTTIRINRTAFTIIGVAPEGFHGSMAGLGFEMWAPVTMFGQLTATGDWMLRDRKTRMFRVLTRLKPGVTIEQAREEVRAIARRMAEADTYTNQGISATLLPLWKAHFSAQALMLGPLSILMGACVVLLLIVCANVANLLLARASGRQKEFSIRLALGRRTPGWFASFLPRPS
jgi:predicted permease